MPSRKKKDGTYADVAHPLNSTTRTTIENAVIEEYRRVVEEEIPEVRNLSEELSEDESGEPQSLFGI